MFENKSGEMSLYVLSCQLRVLVGEGKLHYYWVLKEESIIDINLKIFKT